MKFQINDFFLSSEKAIFNMIRNFNTAGILFGDGKRNKIKVFNIEGKKINIKSFKNPHLINKIAYKYFRRSKARRSFEYATKLLEKGIGTPQPIAYFENQDLIGLKDSYYVSEHLDCDLTFRDFIENPNFPDNERILKQFSQFCFLLHEKGIEFLDHSPGNTLIKKNSNGDYDFFLVDLNRMNFKNDMTFDARIKNMCRLSHQKEMVIKISTAYAAASSEDPKIVFDTLWKYTSNYQYKYYRKIRIKKYVKFWKK